MSNPRRQYWVTESGMGLLAKDLTDWLMERMFDGDHGCLTGDCPHEIHRHCVESLLADFYEDVGK